MGGGVGGGGGGGAKSYTLSQKGGSGGCLYRISVERGGVCTSCTPPDPALQSHSYVFLDYFRFLDYFQFP